MTTQDVLNWRYATKKFDTTKKIKDSELHELLEALRLAPSSFGLEPWKFLVIQDIEIRKKLQPHAWNQPQITEASCLVVLCVQKTMTPQDVKSFIARTAKTRNIPVESLAQYEQMMLGFLANHTPATLTEWMKKQVYLALGMLLAESAHRKIDSCPMEGFDAKKFDEILDLEKQGLQSVVLCPLGYRAPDDKYAQLKKVRLEKSEVLIYR